MISPLSGQDIVPILDLGLHACADTFIPHARLEQGEPVWPLRLGLDQHTGLVHVMVHTDARQRYTQYDYSYTSSNSSISRTHWQELAALIDLRYGLQDRSVLEIGSNDGYLLTQLRDRQATVLGIDPSDVMCDLASQQGIATHCDMFGSQAIALWQQQNQKFDLVISNNVLNHSNDCLDFAQSVSHILHDDGVWILEVPYWADLVREYRFDQIYHEHVSYFTVRSLRHLMDAIGFGIVGIECVDYHGGSLRVAARRGARHHRRCSDMIQQEHVDQLYHIEYYAEWYAHICARRDDFLRRLLHWRQLHPGCAVIGVGAAAKANTLLNFYRLDRSLMHSVTDASSNKKGKYTPLSRIPIVDDLEFDQHTTCAAVILSWNIAQTLKDKVLKINPAIEFIAL